MPRYNRSPRKGRGYAFLELVFFREDLKSEISELRDRWGIVPDWLLSNDDPSERKIEDLAYNTDLEIEVSEILKKLNIPQIWLERIHQYVLDNGMGNVDYHDYSIEPEGIYMTPEEDNWITLEVGPKATFEDLRIAWDSILEHRDKPLQKNRTKKNARRDLQIFRLYLQGKKPNEIVSFLAKEGGEIISEGVINKVVSEKKKEHKRR